ncbi:hypothetical protein SCHPADRAFT_1001583 [Schizopora paradoxa]|uniref:Caffeine-induced death protein 2 n=1 Tax=Schizopora paradoxa TaxID=27342 RepID=A0A0H2R6S0_9AGAM|nr:hypothetical protein SCHPADRAFT_1001583 [Schizopora paradoxa]
MPPRPPQLGSQAVHSASASTRTIHVNEETCHNISLFKELMKEYRKLDDSVTMRMNRSLAQFRDRDRMRADSASSNPQEESCAYFWKELVANWEKRSEIIHYCVDVVGESIQEKQNVMDSESPDSETHKSARSASYSDEVKRNQIRNELAIEAIVRQRSLDAFKSRCRFFNPPLNDPDSRKWWSGRPAH